MALTWRTFANWAKRSDFALRVADRLGRSRGRLRLLDRLRPAPAPPPRVPSLKDWETRELAAIWIGHATVLLRVGGKTILTDPVFSSRVGIGFGLITAGPLRLFRPALPLRKLPRIDLVLLSHAHFDHLDRPTLALLPRRTPIITASHTSDLVTDLGLRRVTELNWGEHVQLDELRISACPVQHWGARTFHDNHRGYNAYLIESLKHRVLYGGDTAYTRSFCNRGNIDLAILGIGAYDPYVAAHATPEQAWQMANEMRAKFLLPIHHSTFRLSHEPIHEPIQRLLEAAGADQSRIVARAVGDQWSM